MKPTTTQTTDKRVFSPSFTADNFNTSSACLLLIAVSCIAVFTTIKAGVNQADAAFYRTQYQGIVKANTLARTHSEIAVTSLPINGINGDARIAIGKEGNGSIYSTPSLKDPKAWGATGNYIGSIADAAEVTLHVKPDPGYQFVGWRGSHFQDKPPYFSELTTTIKDGDVFIAVFAPMEGGLQ